mmetsp:Transcript_16483/g.28259  ORF Transcript_16483/g.28259 Transcript_16483/m.28259 type:complete len:740 (-) Transcript_16483:558-2777(-)
MKYGKYLEDKQRPEWSSYYVNYKALKDLIKEAQAEAENGGAGGPAFSPRTTSLTVQRVTNQKASASERFFKKLEEEVKKINDFTASLVMELRKKLSLLLEKAPKAADESAKKQLLAEAKKVGDEFLALEKFVNLNYMGFHKILKKHDKCLPHAPCRQFYISHLHQQPWVQGNYSDLLVALSNVHSKLRGDAVGEKNEDAAQGFTRSTTKYWVRNENCSAVKHHLLQHLPVFQFDKNNFAGDAQLINSVYLDNSSCELYHGRLDKKPGALALRVRWYGSDPAPGSLVFMERKTHKESWKGEESVKERFLVREDNVVGFIDGDYTLQQALADLEAAGLKKGKPVSQEEKDKFTEIFTEIGNAIDSKQLRPFIRTQYMRTAFQIPFDATVRVSLDTNLTMIKENPEEGPTCSQTGRWYRDPHLPIHRTELTRFPHAVLEVKLSLPEGMTSPPWVQEMVDSGYLTEVHKFSKFIHGTATLFPDMVRAVPYWVDDVSVRPSMLESAPEKPSDAAGSKPRVLVAGKKAPAKKSKDPQDELTHPLLGDQPTLKLMADPDEVQGFGAGSTTRAARQPRQPNWFMQAIGLEPPSKPARTTLMKIEPKTFFANERTFLAWLHMAVTLGSISAALLGFAAGSDESKSGEGISRHLVELIALILLPLGMAMAMYALYTFVWRANNIAKKKATQIDDRYGPLALCGAVVAALVAIFMITTIDFWEVMAENAANTPPSPSPPAMSPPLFIASL